MIHPFKALRETLTDPATGTLSTSRLIGAGGLALALSMIGVASFAVVYSLLKYGPDGLAKVNLSWYLSFGGGGAATAFVPYAVNKWKSDIPEPSEAEDPKFPTRKIENEISEGVENLNP